MNHIGTVYGRKITEVERARAKGKILSPVFTIRLTRTI